MIFLTHRPGWWAYVFTTAWGARYSASARVMLPDQRIVSLAHSAEDPQAAARPLRDALAAYRGQVRTERDLVDALGPPLLAARAVRADTMRPRCAQLPEHWFSAERRLIAITGAQPVKAVAGSPRSSPLPSPSSDSVPW